MLFTFGFVDAVVSADIGYFLLVLFAMPSLLSDDVIDVDAGIRSRDVEILISLLLLLSFKLRRRTGFFKIRLILNRIWYFFVFCVKRKQTRSYT